MSERSQTIIDTIAKSFSNKKPTDDDVNDFGLRLSTYIEKQKWAARSLSLSPSVCAQYGWKCINSDLLECVTCHAKLCTQEPKMDVYGAYKACVKQILSELRETHKSDCPWPLAPTPESYVKMVPLPKEEALNHFVDRFKPCLQYECSIPRIKDSIPSLLGLNEVHVSSMCKLAGIGAEDVHLIGLSVACMAATGWSMVSKKNGDEKTYVKCESCQRLIWIKSFNLINTLDTEEPPTVELVKEGSPRKKFKLEKSDFDPIEQHRSWCLWVTSNEGKDKESLPPGWKVFITSLLKNVPEEINVGSSPSKEELRNVRSLLESWTSPK